MSRIAILITCYNRIAVTMRCLDGLTRQSKIHGMILDVWLVDDASPDKTGDLVKCRYPTVNVISTAGGLYWCRGMRLAWEFAARKYDYDYFLWLNDDVELKERALKLAVEDSRSVNDSCIIVGATEEPDSNGKISYSLRDEAGDLIKPNGRLQFSYERMNGNFVLIPRRVYQRLGFICDKYRHAYGDHDYAYMAKDKGVRVALCREVVGSCRSNKHENEDLAGKNLFHRLGALFQPKGYNLKDALIYKYRRTNLIGAILSFFHIVYLVAKGK